MFQNYCNLQMQRKVKVAEYRSDLHLYDLESNSYPLANFQADIYNPLVAGWECFQCDQRSRSQGCVRRSRSASGHHHGLHRPGSGGSAASTTGDTNENKIFICSYQLFLLSRVLVVKLCLSWCSRGWVSRFRWFQLEQLDQVNSQQCKLFNS